MSLKRSLSSGNGHLQSAILMNFALSTAGDLSTERLFTAISCLQHW